ncbi:MAG: NACHT domain-containing protein [Bacteroidetes bacterium]|nr:NACHT domain-containing protein [Bacteroidota bacterium]
MSEPWDLEEIFVKVHLLDKKLIQEYDREKVKSEFASRNQELNEAILDGFVSVNEHKNLMIIGYPGNGKSTFLKKIGLEALKGKKGNLKFRSIPILLELKNLRNSEKTIKDLVVEMFTILKFPEPETSVEKLLEKGDLLILLDGFDEIPESLMPSMYSSIQNFCDEYDKNRFVISCRINIYNQGFSFRNFKDIKITLFDDTQVKEFVNLWFKKDNKPELVPFFIKELNANSASKELSRTPVLLTLMCLMYNKNFRIPRQQNELYKEAIDVWLERWWKTKQTEDNTFLLDPFDEKILLSEIAYKNFIQDKLFFSYDDLISQINVFLESKEKFKGISSDLFLKNDLLRKQGLLVNRVANEYSFSHLTFQEYFTAYFIFSKSLSLGNDLIFPTIEKFGDNKKWRYVFILLSGFIQDPIAINVFLKSLALKLPSEKNTKKFKILFRKCFELIKENHKDLPLQLRLIHSFYFIFLYTLTKFGSIENEEEGEEPSKYSDFSYDFAVLADTFIVPLQRDRNFPNQHIYKEVFSEHEETLWELRNNKACSQSILFIEAVKENSLFSINSSKIIEKLKHLEEIYPENFPTQNEYIKLTNDVSQIILSEVGLEEILEWSKQDFGELFKIIKDYFYIYTLLLECKESASAVVIESDWKSLEDTIFNEYNKDIDNKVHSDVAP